MNKILIVEDEKAINELIRISLTDAGYLCRCAYDGMQGADLIEGESFDLVLLDIMLPKVNGYELMEYIRPLNIPVIFLTAKADVNDRVKGLKMGAEDYIVKPFNPLELISRVKAQLRRYKQYNESSTSDCLQYRDLILNKKTRQIWLEGKEIRLTPTEFDILTLLLENKGITLTVKTIYEKVWHEEFIQNDNTVLMHISNLREKIENDVEENQYIKTVWGVGYKI